MSNRVSLFIPYIVFSFFIFGLISLDYTVFNDDKFFYTLSNEKSLSEFLVWRYFSWSSRIIIEAVLFLIISFSAFFQIFFVTLLYLFCALSLKHLLKPQTLLQNVIICFMVASIPFCFINNTGWISNSMNYLFPLIFGIISFESLYNPRPCFYYGIFLILTTFVASGMEQLCVVMLLIFGCVGLYYLVKYKKIMWFYVIQLEICMFNIALFALCPGNSFRFGREIRKYSFDFLQWDFFTLFYRGLSHTMDYFFDEPFCILLVALDIVIFNLLAYDKKTRLSCFSTLVISAITIFLIFFWHKEMHIFFVIDNKLGWYYLLFASLFFCLIFSLFLLYKNTVFFYISLLFIFVGLLSSAILGLSPTLYASSVRIFFYFLFILYVLPLFSVLNDYDKQPKNKRFLILSFLFSFYSYYLIQNIQIKYCFFYLLRFIRPCFFLP